MPVLRSIMNNCYFPTRRIKTNTCYLVVFSNCRQHFCNGGVQTCSFGNGKETKRQARRTRVKSYACRQSICRVSGVKTCSNGIKKFVGITVKIEKYIHDGAGSEIHDAN